MYYVSYTHLDVYKRIVLYSLVTGLGLRCLVELILYIQDYNKGIMPFSTYEPVSYTHLDVYKRQYYVL
ncbi:hypothetical protein AZ024_004984 [Escherichia coli]|nr:hypothetical protein AZ024_004984 [Escherichia coli]